ncbi:MAG: OmpA family protein [Saprospiraceae bacterium]
MRTTFQFVFILLFVNVFHISGQNVNGPGMSTKDYKKFKSAQSDHKRKKLDNALKVYCKLLNKYSGNFELELWTGLAYRDKGQNPQALIHLIAATKEESSKNALLYSTIGEIYKAEKNYKKAERFYNKYLNISDSTFSGYIKVKRKYDEVKFIAEQINNPIPFSPKALDFNINTPSSEYLPQLTADHTTLYFTRRIRNQEDIFFVEKNNDHYSEAIPFDLINKENSNEGAHSISADGNVFIFTHHDDKYGVGDHDLYITKKVDGKWTRPQNMGRRINSIVWDSQPSLSGDGNVLFFSSKRDKGYGGRDIWYSVMGPYGYWSDPINAGDVINTSADESSPFLHADLKTLYFRSNGHIGMGGFDLFVTRRQKGGGWSGVQNLGYPINTEGQEGALTISLDGTKGYFATDFDGDNVQNNLDIYEFDLPVSIRPEPCTYIKIRSINSDTKLPVRSILQIIDLSTNTIISSKKADINGEILIPIPLRKKMMINVSADDYVFYSDNIIVDTLTHGMAPYEKTVSLSKVHKVATPSEGNSFVLTNIFFDSGTSDLQEISMLEINKLADILKSKPSLRLKITGHTDEVGSDSDNMVLSKERAEAVKIALVSSGIKPIRITTNGKGETEPLSGNSTLSGRPQNRRTEFILY